MKTHIGVSSLQSIIKYGNLNETKKLTHLKNTVRTSVQYFLLMLVLKVEIDAYFIFNDLIINCQVLC